MYRGDLRRGRCSASRCCSTCERSRSSAPNAFVTAAGLYFLFGLFAFWWVQRDPLPLPLPVVVSALLAGDVFFIAMVMVAGGSTGGSLPILLFPQLAASGWLLRTRTAFFHAALATVVLLGLDVLAIAEGQITGAQPFQTGLIGFGYFATVGIAVALGRYTKASEDLAAQRGIDVANLEQVNRLIIQDMQDGVLVVDLNGVVRGHNAQVTRLLGGFGRMRGGMRLAEFSSTLHDYWRRWQEDYRRAAAAVQGRADAAAAARAARAHRLGPERRHADLPRGPRPRAKRSAADEARRDGPPHRVDRARGAQSAVGDQPGGAAARGRRRGRARGPAAARR